MNLILHQLILGTTAGAPLTGGGAATAASPDGLLFVALALVFAGVILFLLEVFLPSGGILALLSASSLVGSVVVMFLFNSMLGMSLLIAYFIVIPVALYWGLKVWRGSSVGHKLILGADTEGTDDQLSQVRSEEMRLVRADRIKQNIGKFGVADSTLRPVGFVLIEEERLDAIAEGEVIERGQRVEVVDAYDNQIKVRLATQSSEQDNRPGS